MVIEPVVPLDKNRKIKNNLDLNIQFKNILTILNVNTEIYYLRGVMNFIPPIASTINSIWHFIVYCYKKSNNSWEKYDDFQNKIKGVRLLSEAHIFQILMYTK